MNFPVNCWLIGPLEDLFKLHYTKVVPSSWLLIMWKKELPFRLYTVTIIENLQQVQHAFNAVKQLPAGTYLRRIQPEPPGGAVQYTWMLVRLRGVLSVTAGGQLVINCVSSSSIIWWSTCTNRYRCHQIGVNTSMTTSQLVPFPH